MKKLLLVGVLGIAISLGVSGCLCVSTGSKSVAPCNCAKAKMIKCPKCGGDCTCSCTCNKCGKQVSDCTCKADDAKQGAACACKAKADDVKPSCGSK